jgi:large subunit ribosomal protein L23
MAIFNKKKKEEVTVTEDSNNKVESSEEKKEEKSTSAPVSKNSHVRDLSWVLKKPRITEKAVFSAEKKVYVFEIDQRATKKDIADAVTEFYKVVPIKINVAKTPSKKVTRRKRSGTTTGFKTGTKKAYVYLKKTDSIEIV